ncbi:MAG: TonB-dependent receptor [Lysobacterales bacterium]
MFAGLPVPFPVRHTALCVAVAAALTTPLAIAQSAADRDLRGTLEEVVVTARKRSETMLDIPMSINVVSDTDIARLGAEDFTDLLRSVPSLTAYQNGPGRTRLSIRGIANGGGNDNDTQNQETVGIYLDEMPISMGAMNPEFNLFDLQRVEVLRGPQGTLYGAGSMTGTVRLVTTPPNVNEFEGKYDLSAQTVSEGGSGFVTKALVNVPLAEGKSAVRASVYYNDFPGYIDNVLTGEDDVNDGRSQGARISARMIVNEQLEGTFTFMHHDYEDNGRPEDLERAPELSRDYPSFDGFEDELQVYNLVLNYDMGWASLVSSTSYFDRFVTNPRSLDDLFAIALPPTVVPNELIDTTDTEVWVQEFRLTSNSDGPFNWTAGVYLDKRDTFYLNTFPVPGADAALGIDSTRDFGAPTDNLFWGFDDLTVKTYAVFGEGYYEFDRLTITAGLRYFDWTQDIEFYQSGLFNGGFNSDPRPEGNEDGINPKLNVSYDVNDDWLVYGQAARGFRYGGINGAVPEAVCADELAEVSRQGGDTRFFGPDKTWNYEFGTKGSFADGQQTISATVYHIEWEDIQTQRAFDCGFGFRENVGEATSQGLEIEYNARIGDNLVVSLGGAYMNSELSQDVPNLNAVKGDDAPFVPDFTFNGSIDYRFPVGDRLQGFAFLNAQHVGDRNTEFDTDAPNNRFMDSYEVVNMRVGVEWDRYELSLFANNALDTRSVLRALGRPPFDPDANIRVQPRTIGVSFRGSF